MLAVAVLLSLSFRADDPVPAKPADRAESSVRPGNFFRMLNFNGTERRYLLHVPPGYDHSKPTPVVLALHGAAMNGLAMAGFSGLNRKSDEAGFVVVYPDGTGAARLLLTWNAGGLEANKSDDVGFIRLVLDDLNAIVNVDAKRVFATGMSNGGMMSYRLAAEMSDRIAAIAPVAGTMAVDRIAGERAVPVLHFHGDADALVAYEGLGPESPSFIKYLSVEQSIDRWVAKNGCAKDPEIIECPDLDPNDGTTVERRVYGSGREGSEVVLYRVRGGGHTWPGGPAAGKYLGHATKDIKANDLMWDFFLRHPMP